MTKFIGAVLRSLVSGFLLSAILFSITWAMITGEFPPSLSRVKAGFNRLQAMAAMSEKISVPQLKGGPQGQTGDADLDALLGHIQERQKLGAELLAKPKDDPPSEGRQASPDDNPPAREMSLPSVERRLRELELEVGRLKEELRRKSL